MIFADRLVEEVSRHLVDQECGYEYVSWEKRELYTYLGLAVNILSMVNPKLFVATVEVPVENGEATLTTPCAELSEVVALILPNGERKKVRKSSYKASMQVNRPVCTSSTTTPSYQYDADDPTRVRFETDPPEGAKLVVRCYASPDAVGEGAEIDIPTMYKPILFELMLYYAYGREVESSIMKSRADVHFNHASSLLKTARAVDTERLKYLENIRG